MRMTFLIVVLAVIVGALAWVRLAPSDPARWHQPIAAEADKDFASGAIRVIPAGDDTLARLNQIALATPRTTVLAGSVAEGRITYVTRTRAFGFPDYTTIERDGDKVKLYARLRFGRGDMGVNKARLTDWLGRL